MNKLSIDCRGWGAILWKKWEKVNLSKDVIRGFWAEDYNEYHILVPVQLRDIIVDIQNWLADIYIKIDDLKSKVKRLENFFEERG